MPPAVHNGPLFAVVLAFFLVVAAISTELLAFVTVETARQYSTPRETRRRLAYQFLGCMLGGAIQGYDLIRNQLEAVKLTLIALAAGFLITTVSQGVIPEANREGEPSLAGNLFVGGLSLYTMMSFMIR